MELRNLPTDAAAAGVDGVILPDLPMDVYMSEYKELFESHNLSNTFLISPTTSDERIRKIDAMSDGFIYAVSASSITGLKVILQDEQVEYFARLKAMKLKNPFLIGFGISNHATFAIASKHSAGAIVGSAFIQVLKNSNNVVDDVTSFVTSLRNNGTV